MKNMLQIISTGELGGAAKSTQLQSEAFRRLGFDVTVIFQPGPAAPDFLRLKEKNIRAIEYPLKQKNLPRTILFIRKTIIKKRITVVHSHLYLADFISALATLGMRGVKKISSVHDIMKYSSFDSALKRWQCYLFNLFAYHYIDAVFAVSEQVGEIVREYFHLPKEKVFVSLNGIDLNEYHIDAGRTSQIKSSFEIGPGDIVIISVGLLIEHKGQRYLIEAVGKRLAGLPVKCFIVGNDGGAQKDYVNLTNELSCQDRVFFPGFTKNISDWLAVSHIYVQTSLIDALPRALLEAMNAGVPVIASDLETLGAVVIHRETGLVVKRRSSQEIADAIRYLASDKEAAQRLAENGRRFVRENCSIDSMVKRIAERL